MTEFAGTYSYTNQDNLAEWIKAANKLYDWKMTRGQNGTNPSTFIEVSNDGRKFKISTKTSLKTVSIEFNLDEPYEADPGTGQKDIYTTSMEGNKLITKLVNKNNVVISSREFDDKGFVLTYYANEIKATTTFKKAENLI